MGHLLTNKFDQEKFLFDIPATVREPCNQGIGIAAADHRFVFSETHFFVLEPDEFPTTEEKEQQWVQDHLDSLGKILPLAETAGTITLPGADVWRAGSPELGELVV